MAVVEVRSYSRYSRTISCDSVTKQIGIGRAQNVADAPLMRRIGVGVQEAHRHRLDLVRGEELGEAATSSSASATSTSPLAFTRSVTSKVSSRGISGFGPMKEQIEGLDAVAAPDRIGVAEAARRDQRGARALPLQHRVDGDGRAVQHLVETRAIWQSARLRLSATPRVGSAGTVEVFEVTMRPSTQPTRSVKVPPISMPTTFMLRPKS